MRNDSSGHRMRTLGIGLCLFLLVLLGACSPPMPDTYSPFKALSSRFDDGALGYGLDAYTPSVRSDHAMAYALILSAESIRYKRKGEPEALERARDAATWLMENRDMDADGLIGWGLSFEWDAFQDGSTNPADWPYTITTALAIQGLLDLHDVTADANLIGVALEATRTMLAHAFTLMEGAAWFHYSPSEFDDHDVYNVSAMMLGQLQRLVLHEPVWQEYADLVAAHLLAARLEDQSGRTHWMYSAPGAPGDHRENDLVHAAYIVQGLSDYVRFGGTHEVDVQALYESLEAFVIPGGAVSEMPFGEVAARDWGVGAALYTAALMEEEFDVFGNLSSYFYPIAAAYDPPAEVFYPRQASHALLGLALTSP